ncbi:hypothetical protein GCM10009593_38690 [Microlunatus antarcticus]
MAVIIGGLEQRPLIAGGLSMAGKTDVNWVRAAPSGRSVRAMVASSRQGRGPDNDRLHLRMSPPPEPTWRSSRESRLGYVTPVGRIFIVLGIICAIFGLLMVASIVIYGLIAGDPGCCG